MTRPNLGLIFSALCVFSVVQSTPFYDCGSIPTPTDLRIAGCDKFPCALVRGKNVTAEWDFVTINDVDKLSLSIVANVFGADVKYPIAGMEPCNHLSNQEKCPLEKGKKVTYLLTFPVLKSYPPIKLALTATLLDQNGKPQVCFIIEAKVR